MKIFRTTTLRPLRLCVRFSRSLSLSFLCRYPLEGYKDSAELADECVKQKEREKKARYDAMVQEKNSASSEEKYRQLTQEFRGMGNYENAVQLANECDKQMNVFKKQREEQERQERASIEIGVQALWLWLSLCRLHTHG